jgi:hypothetical protein
MKMTKRRKANSTVSIGSSPQAPSTSPKDVLALGQELVQNLELDARGSTLERWMAHHLAEVMKVAETAVGAEKVEATNRAADLIQRVWSKRSSLPASADPLGGYRDAIAVLSRMMPDANPWAAYGGRHGQLGLLRDLFDTMAKVVVGGILLTLAHPPREVSDVELLALEKEERLLLEFLAWWEKVVRPPFPGIVRFVVEPDAETNNMEGEEQKTASREAAAAEVEASPSEAEVRHRSRGAVAEDLERLRGDLDTLIRRWREEAERESEV